MPRLNRVFQGAVDLATALKQGVLQTALDDMNFININLLTQEENAQYEHRIFHSSIGSAKGGHFVRHCLPEDLRLAWVADI